MNRLDDDAILADDVDVTRYLRGELTAEELDAFEIRMLQEPELLEQVLAAEGLQDGLADASPQLLADDSPRASFKWPGWFTTPAWSLAMTGCAIVAMGLLLFQSVAPTDLNPQVSAAPTLHGFVQNVDFQRSANTSVQVIERQGSGTLLLRIPLSLDRKITVAQLVTPTRVFDLTAPAFSRSELFLNLPAELVATGIYHLDLISSSGVEQRLSFELASPSLP